ncbi:unnamed protein product [Symbiodinium natans]|uniref:Uncharacterized protein n=1 Tax=Symbiodinium natans TaxID=878477 RepID=A0A812UBS0_9DINO|nr:unnamed protein product [Symbiodinium natans]
MRWAPIPIRRDAGIAAWQPSWICPRCAESVELADLEVPSGVGDECRECNRTVRWVFDRRTHSGRTECSRGCSGGERQLTMAAPSAPAPALPTSPVPGAAAAVPADAAAVGMQRALAPPHVDVDPRAAGAPRTAVPAAFWFACGPPAGSVSDATNSWLYAWRADPRARGWWDEAQQLLMAFEPVAPQDLAATLRRAAEAAPAHAHHFPDLLARLERACLPGGARVHVGWAVRQLRESDGYLLAPVQEALLECFGGLHTRSAFAPERRVSFHQRAAELASPAGGDGPASSTNEAAADQERADQAANSGIAGDEHGMLQEANSDIDAAGVCYVLSIVGWRRVDGEPWSDTMTRMNQRAVQLCGNRDEKSMAELGLQMGSQNSVDRSLTRTGKSKDGLHEAQGRLQVWEAARSLAFLPTLLGGLGLCSAERVRAAAYWAAWADALPVMHQRRPDAAARCARELAAADAAAAPSLRAAAAAGAVLDAEGWTTRPDWPALLEGVAPAPAPDEPAETGDWIRGWQRPAARALNTSYRERLLLSLRADSRALLRSQSGAHAGEWLRAIPADAASTLAPPEMLIALRRRLRLPLPLAAARCGGGGEAGCGARVDELGDHRAACARSGLLARRAPLLERAWVRVAREAVGAEGWQRRWWGFLSCAQQRALASTLLGGIWRAPAQPGGDGQPTLSEVVELAEPALPSLLPLRAA